MKFIVKGKEIKVPDSLLMAAGAHAESRGMTLEDYIAEAFTMLNETEKHDTGTSPPVSKDDAERGPL